MNKIMILIFMDPFKRVHLIFITDPQKRHGNKVMPQPTIILKLYLMIW